VLAEDQDARSGYRLQTVELFEQAIGGRTAIAAFGRKQLGQNRHARRFGGVRKKSGHG
jgi:hypothetical protein